VAVGPLFRQDPAQLWGRELIVHETHKKRLIDLLFFRFEREGTSLFALLDGARDPQIYQTLIFSDLEYACLFGGELPAAQKAAAPYLVKIVPGSRSGEQLIERGWGQSWGLFLAARSGLWDLRRHLRGLLEVETPDGPKRFFRYYDPRVLRSFLPTCDAAQLREMFGPVDRFDMEAPDSEGLLRYRLVPEPSAPAALRSWTYSLSQLELQQAPDDHGQLSLADA
jgi:hypothetical protein